jgi:hydrogenase/urease accessory protein HupE
MAAGTSATAYGAGFVLATGLLQLAGVGLGVSLARTGRWVAAQGVRVIGAGIAFAGMVLAAV